MKIPIFRSPVLSVILVYFISHLCIGVGAGRDNRVAVGCDPYVCWTSVVQDRAVCASCDTGDRIPWFPSVYLFCI